MVTRKKSKLEKWFSFSRHRRRFGSHKVISALGKKSLQELQQKIIDGKDFHFTHGSEISLEQHLSNLKKEFMGQSELSHYHASLIVLIRREVNQKEMFKAFAELWLECGDFLIKQLNTRWLVSAADTFADFSDDLAECTGALAVTSLVNTVKLSETERHITNCPGVTTQMAENIDLKNNRIPRWDGTSAFAIGTDDTLRNFRWRLDSLLLKNDDQLHSIKILREIFFRLQQNDTVYKRFRDCHKRDRTRWW